MTDLPEGARLALLHWPWGAPNAGEIAQAMPPKRGLWWRYSDVIKPLLEAELIERMPGKDGHTFRLTPAGRRALDEIQSGEAGR